VNACPDGGPCQTGSPACHARAIGHCRDPRYAAIVARETARRDPSYAPPPDLPAPTPRRPAPRPPGLAACRHRSGRWACGGEMILNCALGKGQAGIIEPADCRGCPDLSGPAQIAPRS
jgi:hypothetical protein